ncbi:MAG: alcohol dehydrogenase catalytic domain-containing protein [bacterium]
MRVAMYYSNNDVRLEELPRPEIGAGEALVRVEASGICGSDVMEWYRRDKVPLVLGHEIAGEVVEVGEGVESLEPGQRVSASHHVPCGACRHCRRGNETMCETLRKTNFDPGGFAEFVRLPSINVERGVYHLPDSMSCEEGSFIEPLACVLRGQRRAGVGEGDCVLVLGSGISGALHVALARALGAGVVIATDVSDFRLKKAKKSGAHVALKADEDIPARVREASGGHLADRVIVCTGAPAAVGQALGSVERGGSVLFFAPTDEGVPFPFSINDVFWKRDVMLTTSYAGSPADHLEAMELIRGGRVSVGRMITHRLGLADAGEGFRLVAGGGESLKVIVEPQR